MERYPEADRDRARKEIAAFFRKVTKEGSAEQCRGFMEMMKKRDMNDELELLAPFDKAVEYWLKGKDEDVLDRLNPTITELTQAIEQEAEQCPEAQRLMTHPGVGPLTALAFVLIIGEGNRFGCGKQIASYLGLVPAEDSSGERRRLGHISKQGNSLLRFLLVEAAQVTVRSDARWRNQFFHLAMRRGRKIAKVAMARRLAVRLYWMWRRGWDFEQLERFGSHAGQPGHRHGVQ